MLLAQGAAFAEPMRNGFDLAGALVPVEEILQGGPPKDGIPAIDRPTFVNAREARNLPPEDMVLAIFRNGIAKAYPIRILNWHEVVNDLFGAENIVVTFCPLCGSGVAFEAKAGGRNLQFGVSGLLYNSDVLLYDRETQSLWSQIRAQAVAGPLKTASLTAVPLAHTTWRDWRARHPESLVLTQKTGIARDYDRDPYAGYEKSAELIFPVRFRAEGFHPKERVLGVVLEGKAKAYPFVELAKAAGEFVDTVSGRSVRIRYSREHQSAEAFDAKGQPLVATTLFWFAWAAFHPETEVYRAARAKGGK
ncbi:MAG: DUF3179 domain-containing protein [Betaproteobacteria bacterium]|nr:DUF3179 domain-containing protein [Betaproteobacteria bacterium]